MKKQPTEILITTHSVALQQGLGALLESLPDITRVKAIPELMKAYIWIETYRPRIIFLDLVGLGSNAAEALQKIQDISPRSQRALLVDDVRDVKWMPKYAEAVLIKGITPAAIAEIVSKLLLEKGESP